MNSSKSVSKSKKRIRIVKGRDGGCKRLVKSRDLALLTSADTIHFVSIWQCNALKIVAQYCTESYRKLQKGMATHHNPRRFPLFSIFCLKNFTAHSKSGFLMGHAGRTPCLGLLLVTLVNGGGYGGSGGSGSCGSLQEIFGEAPQREDDTWPPWPPWPWPPARPLRHGRVAARGPKPPPKKSSGTYVV